MPSPSLFSNAFYIEGVGARTTPYQGPVTLLAFKNSDLSWKCQARLQMRLLVHKNGFGFPVMNSWKSILIFKKNEKLDHYKCMSF